MPYHYGSRMTSKPMKKKKKKKNKKKKMVRSIIKLIVRARMLYADLRGHHGKRWNYEPGDWYMGRKNKRR